MARRLSGLQKEVVHLYRQCIRTAHKKPIENRPHFITYIRREFDKYRSLSRKDFSTIEHLLRVGNRRLEMYAAPELKDIHWVFKPGLWNDSLWLWLWKPINSYILKHLFIWYICGHLKVLLADISNIKYIYIYIHDYFSFLVPN